MLGSSKSTPRGPKRILNTTSKKEKHKGTRSSSQKRANEAQKSSKKDLGRSKKIWARWPGGMRGAAGEDYRRGQGDKMIIN